MVSSPCHLLVLGPEVFSPVQQIQSHGRLSCRGSAAASSCGAERRGRHSGRQVPEKMGDSGERFRSGRLPGGRTRLLAEAGLARETWYQICRGSRDSAGAPQDHEHQRTRGGHRHGPAGLRAIWRSVPTNRRETCLRTCSTTERWRAGFVGPALGPEPKHDDVHRVYVELCDCLQEGRLVDA